MYMYIILLLYYAALSEINYCLIVIALCKLIISCCTVKQSCLCCPIITKYIYTVSQKNDTALACYNFDMHQQILILFGRNVAKKVRSQMVLYLPNSPN